MQRFSPCFPITILGLTFRIAKSIFVVAQFRAKTIGCETWFCSAGVSIEIQVCKVRRTMKRKLTFDFLFALHICSVPALWTQSIQFRDEFISLRIRQDTCVVVGTYTFTNPSPIPAMHVLYYPYALDSCMGFPAYARIKNVSTGKSVPFDAADSGIFFPIEIKARGVSQYRVEYHQPTPCGRMRYILLTTQHWGTKLRTADYELRVPRALRMKESAFQFTSVSRRPKETIYRIHCSSFMPKYDFTVRWERRTP